MFQNFMINTFVYNIRYIAAPKTCVATITPKKLGLDAVVFKNSWSCSLSPSWLLVLIETSFSPAVRELLPYSTNPMFELDFCRKLFWSSFEAWKSITRKFQIQLVKLITVIVFWSFKDFFLLSLSINCMPDSQHFQNRYIYLGIWQLNLYGFSLNESERLL